MREGERWPVEIGEESSGMVREGASVKGIGGGRRAGGLGSGG
jgi:hypothetical protein